MLLDRRVARLLAPWDRTDLPGMTVGVVRDGELVVHRQAGMASLELGVKLGPDSAFRIASVSKQFTCAAILMLAAEGRLGVADDVHAHLPELPDFGARITIAHLMHNTSGLRDMLEIMRLGGVDLSVPCSRADLLAGICRQRGLNFAPGSRYMYSNSNFLLLGLIVERLTGETLPDFLDTRIFAPLGMLRTRMVESTTDVVPHLATGYLPRNGDGGGWMRAAHGFPLGGEGGLVSSVEDLALWVRNMSTGRVGGAALVQALETQAPFTNGRSNNYARGLQVRSYRGVRAVDHGGLWPGYKTEFLRVPETGFAVICISNNGASDPYHLAHAVLDAAIEARPGVHPVRALPPAEALAGLPGRYLDPASGATLDMTLNGGTPMGCANGVPFQLRPTADGRLAASRSAEDFTAALSADGDTLEVEADAGFTSSYRRVAPGAALPAGLEGAYESPDIGAVWTLAEKDGALTVQVAGPLMKNGPWEIEPIEGDVIRIYPPSNLYRAWLDVRVLRGADGAVTGLNVNGGRARHLVFTRMGARP
nr:serine hydrolase domain-containing protein [Limobrevibacterium gyesilva]